MENNIQNTDIQKIMHSKIRLGIWMLLMFINAIILAYRTYPFVGYTSKTQNVIYGIIVTSPFWISFLIYIIIIRRKMSRAIDNK